MPEAFSMKAELDSASGWTSPASMAAAFSLLKR